MCFCSSLDFLSFLPIIDHIWSATGLPCIVIAMIALQGGSDVHCSRTPTVVIKNTSKYFNSVLFCSSPDWLLSKSGFFQFWNWPCAKCDRYIMDCYCYKCPTRWFWGSFQPYPHRIDQKYLELFQLCTFLFKYRVLFKSGYFQFFTRISVKTVILLCAKSDILARRGVQKKMHFNVGIVLGTQRSQSDSFTKMWVYICTFRHVVQDVITLWVSQLQAFHSVQHLQLSL